MSPPGGTTTLGPAAAAPGAKVAIVVPSASDYFTYARPPTRGTIRPLINGRDSNGTGPDIDSTEPLDAMQGAVQSLASGDAVYLAAWFFEPSTPLTAGDYAGVNTWGDFLAAKAGEGVVVRLLINDFDPIAPTLVTWLNANDLVPLNAIIAAMPGSAKDNLKYIVCRHPAHISSFKSLVSGQTGNAIYVASHHQKFLVVRKGGELTCFCGGLDIESRKTPAAWNVTGIWHDIHVQLVGPITRDLEREFVLRWNLSRGQSRKAPLAGWKGYEKLALTPLGGGESAPSKTLHDVQMLRTISQDGLASPFTTDRDDIKKAYEAGIKRAKKFIYAENQYFRASYLAEWIVAQGQANPTLVVILVVVANAGADDGANAITQHGDFLQFDTFDKVVQGLGAARVRIYTMTRRAVHSKFIAVDDAWMCVGSANANVRSFEMDSELNIQTNNAELVANFRTRLWAHNLGVSEGTVASWPGKSFLAQWDAVAAANAAVSETDMAGEGVVAFDYTQAPGKKHGSIPDALADLDLSPEPPLFAGLGLPTSTAPDDDEGSLADADSTDDVGSQGDVGGEDTASAAPGNAGDVAGSDPDRSAGERVAALDPTPAPDKKPGGLLEALENLIGLGGSASTPRNDGDDGSLANADSSDEGEGEDIT